MMAHQLSLRSRPQSFDSLFGQLPVKQVLTGYIRNGQARSIIISGASGCGKSITAMLYARGLVCLKPTPSGSPCNECEACIEVLTRKWFDLEKIDCPSEGDKESIEGLVRDYMKRPPLQSRYRVVHFDEAQGLTSRAQDVLLNFLEDIDTKTICIFTLIKGSNLTQALTDRLHPFHLDLPDYELSVKYLRHLAREQAITADEQALGLIAAYSSGYRSLARSLDEAHQLSGDSGVSLDLVRRSLLRERSFGLLECLKTLAGGDVEAPLADFSRMSLSASEKAEGFLEVLTHLVLRFTGTHRVMRANHRLSLLLDDDACLDAVSALEDRADDLGRRVEGLLDEALEFWASISPVLNESQFEAHVVRFHRWLLAGAVGAQANVPHRPASALRNASYVTSGWRLKDNVGVVDRNGEWLTRLQAREIYEASTFMAQAYGVGFNGMLVIDHPFAESALDGEAINLTTKLVSRIRREIFGKSVKASGTTFDFHRILLHERGLDGRLTSRIIFHLPLPLRQEFVALLDGWQNGLGSALVVQRDLQEARDHDRPLKRHWALVRCLWRGIDPNAATDGMSFLDVLNVPISARGPTGIVRGHRYSFSRSISEGKQDEAVEQALGHLSVWADRAWNKLFTGWELREHKDRLEVCQSRIRQAEELKRAYSSTDHILENTALEAALKAARKSWPSHPKERPRKWRGWWN